MAYPQALSFTDLALLDLGPTPTKEQMIAMSFIKLNSIMTDVPVLTDRTLTVEGMRQIALDSSGGFGKVNTDPSYNKNLPEPWKEQKFRYYNAWELERVVSDQKGARSLKETFSRRIGADLQAMNFLLNGKFWNNRHDGANTSNRDIDCFVGVRPRLLSAGSTSKWRIPAECRQNANGVDISDSSTNFDNAVNKLFKIISDACEITGRPEGDGILIFRNQDTSSRLEQGLRGLGAGAGFRMDKDAWDREVLKYRNATFRNAGRAAPDANGNQSQLLGPEDVNGNLLEGTISSGTTLYTSIFLILAEQDQFHIEQFYPTEPTDPVLLPDQITYRSVLYNFYGLVQTYQRSLVQIYGIKYGTQP